MFRPKLFVTMLLFAAYLILEAACFFGKRVAPDYPDIAMAAIKRMRALAPGDEFDSDGIMRTGVIVRQLVLPLN
ncbi:hypothetical protein IKZ80_04645, partial [bacterium]|nr:hypothetical protein [bacterium]